MFVCGDVVAYCDRCHRPYQVPGEQYMDEGAMCAEHLCPDCASVRELVDLVTLAEGEAEPAEEDVAA